MSLGFLARLGCTRIGSPGIFGERNPKAPRALADVAELSECQLHGWACLLRLPYDVVGAPGTGEVVPRGHAPVTLR